MGLRTWISEDTTQYEQKKRMSVERCNEQSERITNSSSLGRNISRNKECVSMLALNLTVLQKLELQILKHYTSRQLKIPQLSYKFFKLTWILSPAEALGKKMVAPMLYSKFTKLKIYALQSSEICSSFLRFSSTIFWNSFSLVAISRFTVSKVVSLMLERI